MRPSSLGLVAGESPHCLDSDAQAPYFDASRDWPLFLQQVRLVRLPDTGAQQPPAWRQWWDRHSRRYGAAGVRLGG